MKKFKELLFLSNIARLSVTKINKDYVSKLSKYNSFDKFVNSLKEEYSSEKLDKAMEKTDKQLNQLSKNKHLKIITILDKKYPSKLKAMGNNAPLFLYVMGNEDLLLKDNLTVVGTQNPNLDSQNFEYKFTREVIEKTERVILSGLESGCDKIAHTVATDINHETIAFLSCGMNKIEDKILKKVASNILQNNGCLVTTFSPNTSSSQKGFNIRNECLASLSDCILTIQFSQKSNVMEIVNFTNKYNRKVACYLPLDCEDSDFAGNKYILKNNFNIFKLTSMDDLDNFIEFLNTEKSEKRIMCKLKDEKVLILKVHSDGQCSFEFE